MKLGYEVEDVRLRGGCWVDRREWYKCRDCRRKKEQERVEDDIGKWVGGSLGCRLEGQTGRKQGGVVCPKECVWECTGCRLERVVGDGYVRSRKQGG